MEISQVSQLYLMFFYVKIRPFRYGNPITFTVSFHVLLLKSDRFGMEMQEGTYTITAVCALKSDRFGMEINFSISVLIRNISDVKIRPFRYGNIYLPQYTNSIKIQLKSDRFGMEIVLV